MARIKWNSPAGAAIIAGCFTILAAIIGLLGHILSSGRTRSASVPPSKISEIELQFSGSRSNSGSLFAPESDPKLFTAETTKHDDLLWIGERSDGVPSIAFVEIPLDDPALSLGRISVDRAVLSVRSFEVSGDPFSGLGPLLLFQDDYGDLDIGDGRDLWSSGNRLQTFVDENQLRASMDLTQEVRDHLRSAGRALRLKFAYASFPSENGVQDRLTMKPGDVRLALRFHRVP